MPDILNPALSSRSVWTLQEMVDRVRSLTQLRSAIFLPSDEIISSLNDGQQQIAVKWKGFKQQIITGTVAAAAEYNLPQPADARCLQIEEIYWQNQPLF